MCPSVCQIFLQPFACECAFDLFFDQVHTRLDVRTSYCITPTLPCPFLWIFLNVPGVAAAAARRALSPLTRTWAFLRRYCRGRHQMRLTWFRNVRNVLCLEEFGLDMVACSGRNCCSKPCKKVKPIEEFWWLLMTQVFSDYGASSEYPAGLLIDTPGSQGQEHVTRHHAVGITRPGMIFAASGARSMDLLFGRASSQSWHNFGEPISSCRLFRIVIWNGPVSFEMRKGKQMPMWRNQSFNAPVSVACKSLHLLGLCWEEIHNRKHVMCWHPC